MRSGAVKAFVPTAIAALEVAPSLRVKRELFHVAAQANLSRGARARRKARPRLVAPEPYAP